MHTFVIKIIKISLFLTIYKYFQINILVFYFLIHYLKQKLFNRVVVLQHIWRNTYFHLIIKPNYLKDYLCNVTRKFQGRIRCMCRNPKFKDVCLSLSMRCKITTIQTPLVLIAVNCYQLSTDCSSNLRLA